jgi:hypothetical protein
MRKKIGIGGTMKHSLRIIALILLFTTIIAHAQEKPPTRPFHMGFTPFPYAISFEAVEYTYNTLATESDLIAHHFDSGVPWVEALEGKLSEDVIADWEYRRANTPDSHIIYLSVTPINFERSGLAPYRGTAERQPLPAPWDTYTFNHPDVKEAFFNYVEQGIAFFSPAYINIGVEVNLVMKINPTAWDAYVELQRDTYTRLKALHPDLPIFVSMTGIDLLEGYTDANHADQLRAFDEIIPYTDIFALSVYPYLTNYMTTQVPESLYDDLAAMTDKPLAIAETGYPAQDFAIIIEGMRIEFESDETTQEAYIQFLLDEAHQHNAVFVVNFVLRDYDALWQAIGGKEDLIIAWRDTGLFGENGEERPALQIWRDWLAVPYMPPTP